MSTQSILIVEDEPTIAYILQESLSDLSDRFDVRIALSGREALEYQRQRSIDLLITDYYLEDTNALDLVSELRAVQGVFKWILITAFGSQEMEDNARELGVYALMNKPFPLSELKRTVLQAMHPAI